MQHMGLTAPMLTLTACMLLGCSGQSASGLVCGTDVVESDAGCVDTSADSGVSRGDARADAQSGSGEGCDALVTFFKDDDGDGFGGRESRTACKSPGPGWVTKAGDCDDAEPLVNPDTKQFSRTPTKAGLFDYDCDGIEIPDPVAKLDPTCGGTYPDCSNEEGYRPTSGRVIGPGMNAHCGSTAYISCSAIYANGTSYCGGSSKVMPALACR